jgi:hypothetical protein
MDVMELDGFEGWAVAGCTRALMDAFQWLFWGCFGVAKALLGLIFLSRGGSA